MELIVPIATLKAVYIIYSTLFALTQTSFGVIEQNIFWEHSKSKDVGIRLGILDLMRR